MTTEWAGIVLVNAQGELLLNLRDDSASNRWPNCWDVIGGTVEQGETPDECLVREVREEIGEALVSFQPVKVYHVPFEGSIARFHVYSGRLDKPAGELTLCEGQEHRFFRVSELDSLTIARGTDLVLRDFIATPAYEALCR
jgi:8-oxo-dGTP diphosphatase